MKRKRKRTKIVPEATTESPGPTVFEQVAIINSGLAREVGLVPIGETAERQPTMPQWCLNIIRRLGKTVLKPIIKLRPNGEINWRNYGKLVGIVERYKAFVTQDVPRILAEEFGDLTDEQWKKLEPLLGLDKLRAHLIKVLERQVADDEPLEKLIDEVWGRQSERLDKMKQTAFVHLAQQSPKIGSLFFKGMAEGYESFIDERANFCGDRGRTDIYMSLISYMSDVERIRRTQPQKTRPKFYDDLRKVHRFPADAYEWFNDVCDDIKFPIKSVGAPPKSAPAM
jgi:hypothetical protein